MEPERAVELLDRTCSLAERVEANADDVELVRSARVVRALVISQRGGMDEAIALLEGVKPARPLGIEGMLAGLHSMRGERETCLKLCQEMLFWGEMNVMQSIGMQLALYTEDPAHLAALLRAAEGVMEGFDVEEVNPMEAATFCGSAATACLRAGDEEGALSYLERFVGCSSVSTWTACCSLGAPRCSTSCPSWRRPTWSASRRPPTRCSAVSI